MGQKQPVQTLLPFPAAVPAVEVRVRSTTGLAIGGEGLQVERSQ
jgi:hypothetical protein